MNGYLFKGYQKLKFFYYSNSCLHVLNFNEVSDVGSWILQNSRMRHGKKVGVPDHKEPPCPPRQYPS